MVEKKIETKKLEGFSKYLKHIIKSCKIDEEEARLMFIESSKTEVFSRKGTNNLIKKFYKNLSTKISSMTYNNVMGNEYKYDISKQEVKIVLMDIVKMMSENENKLKKIEYHEGHKNKNEKYITNIHSILDKMIRYMIIQISNKNFYLGEISSLILIKNQLELILYNDEVPSKQFTELFENSKEIIGIDENQNLSSNKLIENIKLYYYGWTMENLNKEYMQRKTNITNLNVIDLDEWIKREKEFGYKDFHPSMDMEGKLGRDKLLFENKNYYSKDNENISIRINKSMYDHLSRMDRTLRYDQDRNRENLYETISHYLITIIKKGEISTYMIPYNKYIDFFEHLNTEKEKYLKKKRKEYLKKGGYNFLRVKMLKDNEKIFYTEKTSKDPRNLKDAYFSFKMSIESFDKIFEQYEIKKYLESPERIINKKYENDKRETTQEELNELESMF